MSGEPLRIAQILGKMNGGGVEQAVMNYYSAIDRDRIQFDFFLFKGSRRVPIEEIKGCGGRIYALCGFRHPFRYVRTLSALLKENGYRVVHCHLGTLSFLPLLAAKRAGVPVRILHNHSTAGGGRELVRNAAKVLLKPWAKLFATDFLACSEYAAHWMYGKIPVCGLDDFSAPHGSVRIMNNAIDTNAFRFDRHRRRDVRRELGIAIKTLVFGHVGRFCPQKNQQFLIDIFIEILKIHGDSRLVLVGEGSDKELIKARVISAGISDKVIFTGQRSDTAALYSAFDCFLLPSQYEGLPVVGVEAQCSGLPCLFSDRVTREAKLTENAHFLSLKSPAADWACAAEALARLERNDTSEQTAEAGFDILSQGKRLERFYLSKQSDG